jgi:hypothetical protein
MIQEKLGRQAFGYRDVQRCVRLATLRLAAPAPSADVFYMHSHLRHGPIQFGSIPRRIGEAAVPYSIWNNPDLWRQRAQEARTLAELMTDPGAKENMLKVAVAYEEMAGQAAQHPIMLPKKP